VPLSIPYEPKEDIKLGQYLIPKGTQLVFGISGLHNNPQEFPNPRNFNPERFNPNSEHFLNADGKKRHPWSFSPFSNGFRNCAGQNFALTELKTVFIYAILRMKYELPAEYLTDEDRFFGLHSKMKLLINVISK
jgi:cytochrome P450